MNSEMMPNFLCKRAFLTPDRPAIFFRGQTLTFKELFEQAAETATDLAGMGLVRGNFAGVLLKNHLDTVIILFALQLLDVKAVLLNNRLTTEELNWQLDDSQVSFLLTEKSFEEEGVLELIQLEKDQVILKEAIVKAEETSERCLVNEIDLKEICTIMYTSGTTGSPKGVQQTYGNHWWSAVGSALNLGLAESDCWLCAVPLFHISGFSILMRCVIYGIPIVLHDVFKEEAALADIQEKQVTIMSVVSLMLSRLLEKLGDGRLPSTFRCMLLGGGPAPLSLLENCSKKEIPVFQTYGMTETASQIVTLSPEYSFRKLGSAGKPLFPSQLKIVLASGFEAAPDEAGEIVVKGPNVTPGYLNHPQETKDGWLYTGDIGYLDSEGFLYVLDRRSDLIISGGENIYPAEIEAVLLELDAVADVGVTAIADERWGQVPVAFIVKKDGFELTEDVVHSYCRQHLAKYKNPKAFYFVKELPRNASKKLLRRKLLGLIR